MQISRFLLSLFSVLNFRRNRVLTRLPSKPDTESYYIYRERDFN